MYKSIGTSLTVNHDKLRPVGRGRGREMRDLGADLGVEIVLVEGGVEVLDGEGDALHGGGAAPIGGLLEEFPQLLPLLLGGGERVRAGDNRGVAVGAPHRRLRGDGRGGRPREWGGGDQRPPESGGEAMRRQGRHFLSLAT